MKIQVRFNEDTRREDAEEFLKSLGLDPERWLEDQTLDTEGRGPAKIFGMPLSLDAEELAGAETWICSIYKQEGSRRFGINGQLLAAEILSDYDVREVLLALPKCIRKLSFVNLSLITIDKVVVEALPSLTSLNLRDCDSLTDVNILSELAELNWLCLRNCKSINDLKALSRLSRLTSLDLSECRSLTDLSPLAGLGDLRFLSLSRCRSVTNLEPLSSLTKLISLSLSWCDKVADISFVKRLPELKNLSLSRCYSISDLSVLAGLNKIMYLDLSYCKSTNDLSALLSLTQLSKLNLSGVSSFTDLSDLSELHQLQSLNLSNCYSLTDINILSKFTKIRELNISSCYSLTDLSVLACLNNLISLNLDSVECLLDLRLLAGLTQLEELNIRNNNSLCDINDLSILTRITKLDLSLCKSLTNLSPLSNLKKLNDLNLEECGLIRNITSISDLLALRNLNINQLNRLRSIEPLRKLPDLRVLKSTFNPALVAELLAHTAVLRSDKDHISKKSGDWLQEAIAFTDGEKPEQERFATSLGEAFCLLGKHAIELPYEAYLQSKPDFSSAPWKAWLEGTRQQSGSELMRRRIERQDIALSTPGCIGGICAVMPDQSSSDEDQAWGRDWLAEMEAAWQTRSKELLPVSAEVCLAHARLGLQQALGCWLDRFTDSFDPAALDPVQAALGQWQLDQNDTNAALHHAMAIHQPQVRDPLLGRIVERCHSKEADLAGRTLLMITDEALAGRLASSLAQDEIFVASASNVERLIVSCGTSAQALAELIGQISPTAEATPLQALSARLQSNPEAARELRRSMLLRLIDEI